PSTTLFRTHGQRDEETDQQANQHRHVCQETAGEFGDQQDNGQYHQGNAQIFQRTVFGVGYGHAGGRICNRGSAAANPVQTHAHQCHTNNGDDDAGHDRGEQAHQTAKYRSNQNTEDTGQDGGAKDTGQAQLRVQADGDHGPDRRKRHTHYDGQLDAENTQATGLDNGNHATAQQVSINQECDLFLGQAQGCTNDQGDSNCARVHHHDVLQTKGCQAPRW